MLTINVSSDIQQVVGTLARQIPKQVNFAAAKALTLTAQIADVNVRHEMRDVFDRPTPWTLGGTFIKPATTSTLTALVGLKDSFAGHSIPAAKYLQYQIVGGERRLKRYERALRSVGALPDGYFTVPGSAAEIDAYGNINSRQIIQLLSYFRAFPEDAGFRSNLSAASKRRLARGTRNQSKLGTSYFAGRPGNGRLPFGIWKRVRLLGGTAIKPILIFVQSARYAPRFDFPYVVKLTVDTHFARIFRDEYASALATAL